MKSEKLGKLFLIISLAMVTLMMISASSFAQTERAKLPARAISMAAEYPGVEIAKDEDVSIDVIFHNKGRKHEDVEVWISEKPKGWKARIKTYRYTVTGVHVPSNEDKSLTFEADPEEGIKPGDYQFRINARTSDGKFRMSQAVTVKVSADEGKSKEPKGVKLTTSYPVIRGPSDAAFEFSLEVDSKLDEDAVFDLLAQGPQGWDINFKPAYETKYISSLRIKSKQSTSVAVEVKPAMGAAAGEYPINVRVSSSDANAEANLTVILTGTYGLEVGTTSGLLSLEARGGRPANMSFYVKNTGSATNHDIKFMTFKPENWKVEFKPEKIDAIEAGDLKQVELIITPYEDALVGDYSVGVNVEGEKAAKTIEFRTTVKASAAWGWIGIGIIVVVIGGLFGLFRWLGRR
ncbi:MAG: NEW3 domain-containing protein [Desulfobacterales bacterium]|nr:NEW3 domain-containing protein [Desulfobacterales bacterium]MDH3877455.1 NEW3 domain-containing protein [Desulfobacterales bacterium]